MIVIDDYQVTSDSWFEPLCGIEGKYLMITDSNMPDSRSWLHRKRNMLVMLFATKEDLNLFRLCEVKPNDNVDLFLVGLTPNLTSKYIKELYEKYV